MSKYKTTVSTHQYEFECPSCGGDFVLACYHVLSRDAFSRIAKITVTDENNNEVEQLYCHEDVDHYDLDDFDDPVRYMCQHCGKTWYSVETMVEQDVIKLKA